jgi:hypothetical protein
VSIPCWPVTLAVSPISISNISNQIQCVQLRRTEQRSQNQWVQLGKRENPQSRSVTRLGTWIIFLSEILSPFLWITMSLNCLNSIKFQKGIKSLQKCNPGSSKFYTYYLQKLPTTIKESHQIYCSTAYSRSGVNQMWIFKKLWRTEEHVLKIDGIIT